MENEVERLGITLITGTRIERIESDGTKVLGVASADQTYLAPQSDHSNRVVRYPQLGAEGDGLEMARSIGHKIIDLYPAMMPLRTAETWLAECRADTIPKVEIRINLPKAKGIRAHGDLIFTQNGIRGPVVLDVAREITPSLRNTVLFHF